MIKIMLSAGEVSGDIHAAFLARELKMINPSAYLFGMGGEKMRACGVDVKYDLTAKGTVGVVEILRFLPNILIAFFKMKHLLKKERPDVLVLVDYQGFNILLAKEAKKLGIKTIYYIAPQEWLWGTQKGINNVAAAVYKILSVFEEELDAYKKAGANIVYIGHPLLDIVKPSMDKETFCRSIDFNPNFPVVGLFPGSRSQEIESLTKILMDSAKLTKNKVPNAQFVISLSAQTFGEHLEKLVKESGTNIKIVYGKNYDILNASNVCIAASGTVILESVILGTPVIMLYKLSRATHYIAKRILKISLPYYCMPNLIAKKEVVPEYIQESANPENLSKKTLELLTNKELLSKMKEGYKDILSHLGSRGAVKRATVEIFNELKGKI